jgi:Glyoxalase-like domain
LMGTHNRLFNVASSAFPRAYFEIIAIDPAAVPARAPGLSRWFDLDDAALQQRVANDGPQLVHWVARMPALDKALADLAALGIDRGKLLAASRMTAGGLLQWRMSIRDDGQRLFDGALPTLIEWGKHADASSTAAHPAEALPASGVVLQSFELQHPEADALRAALHAVQLDGFEVAVGPPGLFATLRTPMGPVTLGLPAVKTSAR